VLLLILLVLAPLAEHIPLPVLSGILIKVGLDILDYRMLRHLKSAPRHDLSVMASVFFLTVFVDLIVAVGVGVVLACVLIIHRLTQESSVDIVPVICPVESEEDRITDEGIRVINITGAFFFGSTSRIIEAVEKVYDVHSVIIDCSRVPFMDLSAVYALGDTIAKLKQLNSKVFVVADIKRRQKLLALGIGDVLQPQGIYETQDAALDAARA
jgi:sulfate permease, SulP family